jgi:hypothetical protein
MDTANYGGAVRMYALIAGLGSLLMARFLLIKSLTISAATGLAWL